jgi:rod shape-determining protein MreC
VFKVKSKKFITYLVFILATILVANLIPQFRNLTADIFKYPLYIVSWIGREIHAAVFFHRNFRENERLKKEIDLLRRRSDVAQELAIENKRLRSLLNFKQNSALRMVACRVIGRDPSNWSSVVIIDKGKKHGIKPSLAVITERALAGKVIEVGDSTSKVMLINDPNLSVSAILQRSRSEGAVSGTLQNLLIMRYLSADVDIKVSDVVISSGLSQIYPTGIMIGEVSFIGTEFSGLARYALIKPAVNFSTLEEVLVVLGE